MGIHADLGFSTTQVFPLVFEWLHVDLKPATPHVSELSRNLGR